jgi:hypothetical protein
MASDGAIFDVLREIQDDREAEAILRAQRKRQDAQLSALRGRMAALRQEIEECTRQRSWFGLGGIRKKAQARITQLEADLVAEQAEIEKLLSAMEDTAPARETRFGEFAEEKAKLRELLDISSEEHRERHQALVDSANHFVDMTETRTKSVLEHLEAINDQVDQLADGNGGLRNVYALINEAIKEAETRNSELRDNLNEAPEEESRVAEMRRENLRMAVEDHITALTSAKADTIETYSDLTAESYRIRSMKNANSSQVARTRTLSTKGVSGVASRLSSVLQGVSMAALGESSEVAQKTLERMNEQTTLMSHKEALKNAMGVSVENQALVKVIEELESYGKVARAATDISREGFLEMKDHLAALEQTVSDVSEAVKEAVAIGADVNQGGKAIRSGSDKRDDERSDAIAEQLRRLDN